MEANARNHKEGRWAREICALQQTDGSWGYFHTLSRPTPQRPMTTEQALRRLQILGFTKDDPCVARALDYLRACLNNGNSIPDRREKLHDWDIYVSLMLCTWIRHFDQSDPAAVPVAERWRRVMEGAFASGVYGAGDYAAAYIEVFGKKPKGGRLIDFIAFYPISLLAGEISPAIERAYFDHVVSHAPGIYYIYGKPLDGPPPPFRAREASWYLAAAELLLEHPNAYARERLRHVYDWLMENRSEDGSWDMGQAARNGVHFPLSDSWRNPKDRIADCTERIESVLAKF